MVLISNKAILTPLDELRVSHICILWIILMWPLIDLSKLLLLGLCLAVEQVEQGDRVQEISKEHHRPYHDIECLLLLRSRLFWQEWIDGDQNIVGNAVDDLEQQVEHGPKYYEVVERAELTIFLRQRLHLFLD